MGCPNCAAERVQVIYFGLPGVICPNQGCNLMTGPAAHIPAWLQHLAWGDDGACLMVYRGAYLPALWRWLYGG